MPDTPPPAPRRARLSSGREILYFDDAPGAGAPPPDPRPADDPPRPSTVRQDPLTGDWVTIAAHRNTRTFLPPADECPLCPAGRGSVPSEIPAPAYDVVVFENRFPSFAGAGAGEPGGSGDPGEDAGVGSLDDEPLFATRAGRGRCEVLCFTSDHDGAFSRLPLERVRTIVAAWAHRTAELSALDGVAQVCCFENRGEEIGVTLHHPHGQVYGYPFVPPRSAAVLARAAAHRRAHGTSLLRDVLDAERRAGTRVVLSGQQWTAYVPAAARWPLEVHLAPHRDVADLAELDDAEREELAEVYLELLRRCDRYHPEVDSLPYISAWHQAPLGEDRPLGRLHLQLFSLLRAPGKLKYLAGSESAMGAWINDVTPETVAWRLREVAS
ncbi:MAG: galactose-1-phosphate uridylyltransferase [Kineosporiaceae bacterium]